ncbi:MAG: hypothetical protein HKP13_11025, partial [Gammaproteobacteria bacterium]|nr:hypothetical protein [Gammaproteobacteria bacterium]
MKYSVHRFRHFRLPPESIVSNRHRLTWLTPLLLVLAFAYFGKGFYFLTVGPIGAGDLHKRWVEQQYIYQGIDPYHLSRHPEDLDPDIGPIRSGGYLS